MRVRFIRAICILGCAAITASALASLAATLTPCPDLHADLSYSRRILDRNGKVLRLSLSVDGKYRMQTELSQMPAGLLESVLLHEDRSFYTHSGIDLWAIMRAGIQRCMGRSASGASTISMQLARMRFRIESRTWGGKLEQAFRALQLEAKYSKAELLESYLNRASYGGNVEGIGAASLIYFGKAPLQLTQAECDALSLIPQRPGRRSRMGSVEPPDLLEARRRLTKRRTNKEPELAGLYFQKNLPFECPHLVSRLEQTDVTGDIRTTIDLRYQNVLEQEIKRTLGSERRKGVRNASVILVNYRTGDIISYIGSAGFWDEAIQGQVDGVTMKRSPGSAAKPFIYAAALQEGLIHPGSMLTDSPISMGSYEPENFDKTFMGRISLKSALLQSRNIPAVLLAAQLRSSTRARLLSLLGVTDKRVGAGMAVGGFETSMERLAALWCALANEGESVPLRFSKDKRVGATQRLFTKEASCLVLDMLASPENSHPLLRPTIPIAWKTGTSQGFRDAWCCAAFDEYVLCVWMGSFDGKPNPALVGRDMAAPLLFKIVERIRELDPPDSEWLPAPKGSNLTRVTVCSDSGLLAGPECKSGREEWFWAGVSPVARCSEGCFPASSKGGSLGIVSPGAAVRYVAENQSNRGIPLRVSGSDSTVYWFDGANLLGASSADEPVWWHPSPGNYRLMVVDGKGRSACRNVSVISLN